MLSLHVTEEAAAPGSSESPLKRNHAISVSKNSLNISSLFVTGVHRKTSGQLQCQFKVLNKTKGF